MAFDLAAMLKDVSSLDTGKKQITYLRRETLDADAGNFYEIRDVDALADNISVVGLQQPILVRPGQEAGRYTVVSGHRRLAALAKLAEEDPDKWAEVPCIVEADSASPALQQLQLIYANSDTRQKNAFEIGEEAARVEQLLYQLQEEGYEFPGRMRDHVAEVVGVSRSKLARLKVIREKLIAPFMARFEAGSLPEGTAYVLAQASSDRQQLIYEANVAAYGEDFMVPAQARVENNLAWMQKAASLCGGLKCPVSQTCTKAHAPALLRAAAALGQYNILLCEGCCRECRNLDYCRYSCEYAGDIKKARLHKRNQETAEKKAAEKAEKQQRERSAKDLLTVSYNRVARLREEKNVEPKDFVKASLGYPYPSDISRLQELEHGRPKLTDRMPGGIWADEARHLIATAELLGCSIDYLLGRDVPAQPETAGGGWSTGTPKDPGRYAVLYLCLDDITSLTVEVVEDMWWTGETWTLYNDPLPEEMDIRYWAKLPEDAL